MNQQKKRQAFAGLAIIALGAAMWALRYFEDVNKPSTYLFMVSAALFAFYFFRREEGLLVPAAILGGIALNGLWAEPWSPVGIGCGFLAITVVALAYQRKFIGWPLIPGTILVLFGLPGLRPIVFLRENWPLLLIGIGLWVVLVAIYRRDPEES